MFVCEDDIYFSCPSPQASKVYHTLIFNVHTHTYYFIVHVIDLLHFQSR